VKNVAFSESFNSIKTGMIIVSDVRMKILKRGDQKVFGKWLLYRHYLAREEKN
jgi:hypothetical protein